MKRIYFRTALVAFMAGLSPVGLQATVPVNNLSCIYDSTNAMLTVEYVLSGEAIVTIDVQTNTASGWASVGEDRLRSFAGAVNRRVPGGTAQKAYWFPIVDGIEADMPGGFRAVVRTWSLEAPPDYLVVDLDCTNTWYFYTSTNAFPNGGLANDIYRKSKLVMRKIPASGVVWRMGSPSSESTDSTVRPHYVTLTNDYYMGIYLITQAQYLKFASSNPSQSKGASESELRPVEYLAMEPFRGAASAGAAYDWPDKGHAVAPSSFLGQLRGRTGIDFDLPTEAEWEYACRAGTGTRYNIGTDSTSQSVLKTFAWGYASGDSSTINSPVGRRLPNAWGLYDMHGMEHERCLDWYADDIYATGVVTNPPGPRTGTTRVLKGGGYGGDATKIRSAFRVGSDLSFSPYRGYRVICPVTFKW